eukprot:14539815-Alexandrium_andersonii.AAC.1
MCIRDSTAVRKTAPPDASPCLLPRSCRTSSQSRPPTSGSRPRSAPPAACDTKVSAAAAAVAA